MDLQSKILSIFLVLALFVTVSAADFPDVNVEGDVNVGDGDTRMIRRRTPKGSCRENHSKEGDDAVLPKPVGVSNCCRIIHVPLLVRRGRGRIQLQRTAATDGDDG